MTGTLSGLKGKFKDWLAAKVKFLQEFWRISNRFAFAWAERYVLDPIEPVFKVIEKVVEYAIAVPAFLFVIALWLVFYVPAALYCAYRVAKFYLSRWWNGLWPEVPEPKVKRAYQAQERKIYTPDANDLYFPGCNAECKRNNCEGEGKP